MPIPNYDNEELRIMRYNMMEPCHISSQFGLFGQPEFLVSAHHRQCGTTCLYVPRCVPKNLSPVQKMHSSVPKKHSAYQKHVPKTLRVPTFMYTDYIRCTETCTRILWIENIFSVHHRSGTTRKWDMTRDYPNISFLKKDFSTVKIIQRCSFPCDRVF